jgi:N-terminal acetyltransferase 2
MKKAEQDATGGERINDTVDMAGWGVEQAEKKHKAEASMFLRLIVAFPFFIAVAKL